MPVSFQFEQQGPVGGQGGGPVPPWAMPSDGVITLVEVKYGLFLNQLIFHYTSPTNGDGAITLGGFDPGSYHGQFTLAQGAWALAQAVIQPSAHAVVNANHVLTEPGFFGAPPYDEDAIQFKGIFMRNLSYLASVDPDSSHWPIYSTFIAANANSLWLNSRNDRGCFGYDWAGPFDSSDPSRQSSALDVFVAAIRLDAL